jgi:hypothetical protein
MTELIIKLDPGGTGWRKARIFLQTVLSQQSRAARRFLNATADSRASLHEQCRLRLGAGMRLAYSMRHVEDARSVGCCICCPADPKCLRSSARQAVRCRLRAV